jgi:hypothetical protein
VDLKIYFLILLFCTTLVGYINAMGSRGHSARIVLSYMFATLILIASVFSLISYISSGQLAEKEAEKNAYMAKLLEAEENAKNALEGQEDKDQRRKYLNDLTRILDQGQGIARSILSIDLDNEDDDYDRLAQRAAAFRNQAFELKRKLDRLDKVDEFKKINDARKPLESAVKNLSVGANYFYLFFGAEDEEEEDERFEIYRRNTAAARNNFNKAKRAFDGI